MFFITPTENITQTNSSQLYHICTLKMNRRWTIPVEGKSLSDLVDPALWKTEVGCTTCKQSMVYDISRRLQSVLNSWQLLGHVSAL